MQGFLLVYLSEILSICFGRRPGCMPSAAFQFCLLTAVRANSGIILASILEILGKISGLFDDNYSFQNPIYNAVLLSVLLSRGS